MPCRLLCAGAQKTPLDHARLCLRALFIRLRKHSSKPVERKSRRYLAGAFRRMRRMSRARDQRRFIRRKAEDAIAFPPDVLQGCCVKLVGRKRRRFLAGAFRRMQRMSGARDQRRFIRRKAPVGFSALRTASDLIHQSSLTHRLDRHDALTCLHSLPLAQAVFLLDSSQACRLCCRCQSNE